MFKKIVSIFLTFTFLVSIMLPVFAADSSSVSTTVDTVNSSKVNFSWNNAVKLYIYRDGVLFKSCEQNANNGTYDTIETASGQHKYRAEIINNSGTKYVSDTVSVTGTGKPVISLQYSNNGVVANEVPRLYPWFKIYNYGSQALDLKKLKVRYWFTMNDGPVPNINSDQGSSDSKLNPIISSNNPLDARDIQVKEHAFLTFTKMANAAPKADYYCDIQYSTACTDSLYSGYILGGDAGVQPSFIKQLSAGQDAYRNYKQGDDYSFDATATSWKENKNICVYYDGQLIWGTPPDSLSAPANLTGSAIDNSISLKWDAVNGADKYAIYRQDPNSGVFKLLGYSNLTNYVDTSIDMGVTYQYKVCAVSTTNKEGSFSNIVSIASKMPDGDGLLGSYYNWVPNANNINRQGYYDKLELIKIDDTINFTWTGSPVSGVRQNNFSTVWTGYVMPQFTDKYTFKTITSDCVKLWLDLNGNDIFEDNELIIKDWYFPANNKDARNNASSIFDLTAGKKYKIKMEYYEKTGNAVAKLLWNSTKQTNSTDKIIAKQFLFTDGDGLKGQYLNWKTAPKNSNNFDYDSTNKTNLVITNTAIALNRIDKTIDFNWGSSSPDSKVSADAFSVIWSGYVMPLRSDLYTFYIDANDGARLWIDLNGDGIDQDSEKIINRWSLCTTSSSIQSSSSEISLTAGKMYRIRMEYFDKTGDAIAKLQWKSTKQTGDIIQTIPKYCLYKGEAPILSASTNGSDVNLGWLFDKADSYTVYRGTSATGDFEQIATSVSSLTFKDTSIPVPTDNSSRIYYYKVVPVIGNSFGMESNVVSIEMLPYFDTSLGKLRYNIIGERKEFIHGANIPIYVEIRLNKDVTNPCISIISDIDNTKDSNKPFKAILGTKVKATVNGKSINCDIVNGAITLKNSYKNGDVINLEFITKISATTQALSSGIDKFYSTNTNGYYYNLKFAVGTDNNTKQFVLPIYILSPNKIK